MIADALKTPSKGRKRVAALPLSEFVNITATRMLSVRKFCSRPNDCC